MTSEQVRLILAAAMLMVAAMLPGCVSSKPEPALSAPYGARQVWAVVPLRNESGSRYADSLRLADLLAYEFEQVRGIDVLPVNRVLQAMQALELNAVATREEALALRQVLGVDALIVGTVTAYDPYDPMRLGISLDLYSDSQIAGRTLDIRGLSWAPTADAAGIDTQTLYATDQPVATVSGMFSAASPVVKQRIRRYAAGRGTSGNPQHDQRLITIDMNLYSEFVGHEVASQLMWAERQRLARQNARAATQQPDGVQQPESP